MSAVVLTAPAINANESNRRAQSHGADYFSNAAAEAYGDDWLQHALDMEKKKVRWFSVHSNKHTDSV